MNWSYGVEPRQVVRDTFPGPDAPWQTLAPYAGQSIDASLKPGPSLFLGSASRLPRALDFWFRARGIDGESRLRDRYRSESDSLGRIVFAAYLLMYGDTSSLQWLRAVAAGPSKALAEAAEQLMLRNFDLAAETVADDDLLTDVQERVLSYAAFGTGLADSVGRPATSFSPHDERPDERILVSDGLTNRVRTQWKSRMELLSRDSVEARARREGLSMALTVSSLQRLGRRYYIAVELMPFGQMCLCGGGTRFVLERRGAAWVVISALWWVS